MAQTSFGLKTHFAHFEEKYSSILMLFHVLHGNREITKSKFKICGTISYKEKRGRQEYIFLIVM